MPPACAIAIAMRDSVTVSIAALTSGMLSAIVAVSRVRVSAVAGSTSEAPGHQQHVVEGERLAQVHATVLSCRLAPP